ncbi:MAG: hypothetical protein KAI79_20105, partial [Bacteroidales bacterium]|nr:hypothetical protein [Bacteroidales bacterium]
MPHKNKILIFTAIIAIFVIYKNSYIWFQKTNTEYLIKYNQSTRIFPHRVNTIGKLNDIWNSGFRSFEVDIYFDDHNKNSFILGHNKGEMGGSLEELLSSIEYQEIQRVWLDFKNLNQNNYNRALRKLKYLDNKFNIKKNIIIESSTTFEYFQEF